MNVTIKMASNKRARSSNEQQAEFVQQNKTPNTTSTTPMMRYHVVYASGGNIYANDAQMDQTTKNIRNTLTGHVNNMILQGWKPQGGVSISVNKNNREVFAQAMVK
tara:strand:- start:916 stop:1233 length:318 start_codon:yes stop_codon:yes gene_type:complete